MLAAAGLGASWVFKKARILAIFDDLNTVLFMIPLNIAMIGFHWEIGIILFIMTALLWLAWRYLHALHFPVTWSWVLLYSVLLTAVSEGIYYLSHIGGGVVPIHIEILLPAFVLGCITAHRAIHPTGAHPTVARAYWAREKRVEYIVSSCFMVLVGLSIPPFLHGLGSVGVLPDMTNLTTMMYRALELPVAGDGQPLAYLYDKSSIELGWGVITWHVLIITLISNIGKMFPALCYRKEASTLQRLALAVSMFPRGGIGAAVLVISLNQGIEGPMVVIAVLSLALNIILTGVFIAIVKKLFRKDVARKRAATLAKRKKTQNATS